MLKDIFSLQESFVNIFNTVETRYNEIFGTGKFCLLSDILLYQ